VADQALAGGGRRCHLARPLEESHAEQFLELAELHGEGRLANAAGLGGAAEMRVLGHSEEITEVAEVHGVGHEAVIGFVYHRD